MKDFIYETHPEKVVFGLGKRKTVKEEAAELGAERVLVVSTPGRKIESEEISALLGYLCVGIHAKAIQHVPEETVNELVEKIRETKADAIVAIGGGSSIGLAKAAVLVTPLPILAIPTTYSGSEMTAVWGITTNNKKQTGKDPLVKPRTVIYDPSLTKSMPASLSLTSGMNAMAHCVEALYAENRNPITSIIAEEGIKALYNSLGKIVENPHDMGARTEALYGSWLAGTALGSVGMALHHKLCHALGGTCNLPHAETHTVVLPYVISYNSTHVPEAVEAMARALHTEENNVAETIIKFVENNGGPTTLSEIGMKEDNIENVAEQVTKNSYYNPRPITKEDMRNLLSKAYNGHILI